MALCLKGFVFLHDRIDIGTADQASSPVFQEDRLPKPPVDFLDSFELSDVQGKAPVAAEEMIVIYDLDQIAQGFSADSIDILCCDDAADFTPYLGKEDILYSNECLSFGMGQINGAFRPAS